MSQEDNAQFLSYAELIRVLRELCQEKQSGVMVISSGSGSTARFTLEQGEIFDISYLGQTDKLALLQIKKITRGKTAFFKRAANSSTKLINLSTEEVFALLNEFNLPVSDLDNTAQINTGEFSLIEAYLAILIGPVAQVIYQDYSQDISRANSFSTLNAVIEKMAQQVLSAEDQKTFKQYIQQFINQYSVEHDTALVNLFKSNVKELKLNSATLSLFIQKSVSNGDTANLLLNKLANYIEHTDNLIELISLFDVLRFLEKTNKTGFLSIKAQEKNAGFYFEQGKLVNAFDHSGHGLAVVLDILQWEVDTMYFTSKEHTQVAKEISQSVDVLINSVQASIANKEALKQHTGRVDRVLTADEIQAALSKQIEHLQHKETDKCIAFSDYQTCLTKGILFAESYKNPNAEQTLVSLLSKNDKLFEAWFWLARVLSNMTAIEFALKKAAQLNTKSAELMDEVKKFTAARKIPKGDLVLRCPFCWMPIHAKNIECPHCLADFFIHKQFFNTVGKAKTDLMDQAIARYNKVLHHNETNSNDIYTLFYLAMAYLNRQYYQEGFAQFNEIIKLAPNHSELLHQHGLLTQCMQSKGLLSETKASLKSTAVFAAKILVVEDSVVTRKVIVRTLVSAGYEVFEAKDAEEALTGIEEKQLDLVLLDIILPGDKDGYAILAEIKTKPSLVHVPVIMLTSRDSLFDKIKGKVSDANEYLTKPFQPDELLSVVKKYLK